MEKEFQAISLIIQVLRKSRPYLHHYLISFTLHLFNNSFGAAHLSMNYYIFILCKQIATENIKTEKSGKCTTSCQEYGQNQLFCGKKWAKNLKMTTTTTTRTTTNSNSLSEKKKKEFQLQKQPIAMEIKLMLKDLNKLQKKKN